MRLYCLQLKVVTGASYRTVQLLFRLNLFTTVGLWNIFEIVYLRYHYRNSQWNLGNILKTCFERALRYENLSWPQCKSIPNTDYSQGRSKQKTLGRGIKSVNNFFFLFVFKNKFWVGDLKLNNTTWLRPWFTSLVLKLRYAKDYTIVHGRAYMFPKYLGIVENLHIKTFLVYNN